MVLYRKQALVFALFACYGEYILTYGKVYYTAVVAAGNYAY